MIPVIPAVASFVATGGHRPLGDVAPRVELRELDHPARTTHGVRADGGRVDGEAHRIVVTDDEITIVAPTEEGVHRALTTLHQLAAIGAGAIPCGTIDDAPEFAWRGLSLDVVRTFVPLDEVKRVVDMLSLYKLNVLHLHLTDNEGWRIQIESWPRLTEVGARGATGDRPGGHYTQAEFRDLVAYAAERFVTIVPEIDMPGHSAAAIAAYPELGDGTGGPNLDTGSDTVWRFVHDVMAELAALSPSPFLHIGGDEAFGMDDDAHAAFVTRTVGIVHEFDKRVVGWQEICRGDVGPDEVVQHWIDFAGDIASDGEGGGGGEDGAGFPLPEGLDLPPEILQMLVAQFAKANDDLGRVAEQGSALLLSPTAKAYLDRPHGDASRRPDQEARRSHLGLQVYPRTSLAEMLDWSPLDAISPAPGITADRIAGVEAALWCETVETMDDLETLLLPRLPGVAQVAWSPSPGASWAEHRDRLAHHAALWQRAGWSWYEADSIDWSIA